MVDYDEAEARKTDRAYITPDVTRQRMRTLSALHLNVGETVLDVGCGTGLLSYDMATLVDTSGRVVGVDLSADMLKLARQRCSDLPQVELKQSGAEDLPQEDASFDAVTCIQVLLYVADVETALAEMYRVLKPGGRIAIIETEWRGMVLNSFDDTLTRKMVAAWDAAVPSPNLPLRLNRMMKEANFASIDVDAIPIVNSSRAAGGYSGGMMEQFAHYAREQDRVSAEESKAWLDDLDSKSEEGSYFFCVNRFIFTAVKV